MQEIRKFIDALQILYDESDSRGETYYKNLLELIGMLTPKTMEKFIKDIADAVTEHAKKA